MSKFSKIIAGCMTWGIWGKNFTTKETIDFIQYCFSKGITSFDHADIYGDYSTEKDFGKAFKLSDFKRDQIQLISKCGIQLMGNARSNKVKHYNYSKEYIKRSAEQSLQNLSTDYLDLFLLHRPSPLMEVDEITEVISELKQEGKIIEFGVSNFTPIQTNYISNKTKVFANQIECSLTHYTPLINDDVIFMQKNNIQTMAWSPLGTFFKENTDQNKRIKEVLISMQEKYNATEDQLLLAWLLHHPTKITPVIGTTNKNRIDNAIKATEINLELQDWFILLQASQGYEVP